jgi:hypothetical protein
MMRTKEDMAIESCRAVGGDPDRLIGTARCGPACRVVWQPGANHSRRPDSPSVFADILSATDLDHFDNKTSSEHIVKNSIVADANPMGPLTPGKLHTT